MAGSVGAQSGMIINLKIVDQVMQSFFKSQSVLAFNSDVSFQALLKVLQDFVEKNIDSSSSYFSSLEVFNERKMHVYRAQRPIANKEFSVETQVDTYLKSGDKFEWNSVRLVFKDFVCASDHRLNLESVQTTHDLSHIEGLLSAWFFAGEGINSIKKAKKFQFNV